MIPLAVLFFVPLAVAAILLFWLIVIVVEFWMRNRKDLRALWSSVPAILRLLRDLMRDPRVPPAARAFAWFAAIYVASPIDLVPEFLPIGPLDDVIVAGLALRYLLRRAGPQLVSLYWSGTPEALQIILRFSGLPAG